MKYFNVATAGFLLVSMIQPTLAGLQRGKVWFIEGSNFTDSFDDSAEASVGRKHLHTLPEEIYHLWGPMPEKDAKSFNPRGRVDISAVASFNSVGTGREVEEHLVIDQSKRGMGGGFYPVVADILLHSRTNVFTLKSCGNLGKSQTFHPINIQWGQGFRPKNTALSASLQKTIEKIKASLKPGQRMKPIGHNANGYFYLKSGWDYAEGKPAVDSDRASMARAIPRNPADPQGWVIIPMVLASENLQRIRNRFSFEREGRKYYIFDNEFKLKRREGDPALLKDLQNLSARRMVAIYTRK